MEVSWRASAALLLLAASLATAEEGPRSVDEWEVLRTPVKPFVVKDLAGKSLRLADLSGKIAVVDFWATWCKPCVRELPELAAYHERLADRKDVVLLSFNVGETRAEVERFLKSSPVSFPVYFGDALVEPLELAAFPTKLILDVRKPGPKGTALLRYRREGFTDVASIEARVEELLREAP
jgi:thiol-disulfide isomerase/thioredoxin